MTDKTHFSRRQVVAGGLGLLAAPALPAGANVPDVPWRHGLSLMDTPRYPPGFTHFAYVNPDAPKGGVVRRAVIGSFDSLNLVVAGLRGTLGAGVQLIYDTLMVSAFDEVSTEYGLVAEAVRHPDDHAWVAYRLNPAARWHDGRPKTVADVIWSFEAQRANSPAFARYYRHVRSIEQSGEREVTFIFDQAGNRELPQIIGQLNVMPKHWFEGTDAQGRRRDPTTTFLDIPLGGGAYRIRSVVPGRTIVYERVPDYWGRDLPTQRGKNNFDELRFEYFREQTAALEAFKKGEIDWRTENVARTWATGYDFPAVRERRVILEEFPIRSSGGLQAFVFNMRRERFRDWRVRRAFDLVFDFEEMNKQLFFNAYQRSDSYFEGTELASSGIPEGLERQILETVRAEVPPALFTDPYRTPVNGSPEAVRANLRQAFQLLRDAGFEVRDRRLVDTRTGERMTVEFLTNSPSLERVILFYKPNLERLGVEVTARTVDDAQYINRLRSFDFDAIIGSWGQSLSPGNEQRNYWSSEAADVQGSYNYAGIKNPAVDKLIDRVIFARNREELVAAARALDRVLLWNHYVVPQWTIDRVRTARWDRYGRPPELPRYGASAFPDVWWWDEAKARRADAR